jgi:hypothetical protein
MFFLKKVLKSFVLFFYKIPLSCILPLPLKKRLLLVSCNDDSYIKQFIRIFFGVESILQRFKRFGLQPIDIIKVDIKECNVQRPVLCEMLPVSDASTIDFLEKYFLDSDGSPNWLIENSMHCSMYNSFLRQGELKELQELDYWKWQSYLDKNGINERPPSWIEIKIQKGINVLNSIRSSGFNECNIKNLPWLVTKPICLTRYGIKHKIQGYEIYDGHHRVAALSSLGIKTINAIIVVDNAKFTPFGIPLEKINIKKGI